MHRRKKNYWIHSFISYTFSMTPCLIHSSALMLSWTWTRNYDNTMLITMQICSLTWTTVIHFLIWRQERRSHLGPLIDGLTVHCSKMHFYQQDRQFVTKRYLYLLSSYLSCSHESSLLLCFAFTPSRFPFFLNAIFVAFTYGLSK